MESRGANDYSSFPAGRPRGRDAWNQNLRRRETTIFPAMRKIHSRGVALLSKERKLPRALLTGQLLGHRGPALHEAVWSRKLTGCQRLRPVLHSAEDARPQASLLIRSCCMYAGAVERAFNGSVTATLAIERIGDVPTETSIRSNDVDGSLCAKAAASLWYGT